MVEGLTYIEDLPSLNCPQFLSLSSFQGALARLLFPRGGAVVARRAHNPKVGGSNPSPATRNFGRQRQKSGPHVSVRAALSLPLRAVWSVARRYAVALISCPGPPPLTAAAFAASAASLAAVLWSRSPSRSVLATAAFETMAWGSDAPTDCTFIPITRFLGRRGRHSVRIVGRTAPHE